MRLTNLLETLKPAVAADAKDWTEASNALRNRETQLFWYGGAGFDLAPLVALKTGGVPEAVSRALGPNPVFLATDYNFEVAYALQDYYDTLDQPNVPVNAAPYLRTHLHGWDAWIEEMIPLRCTLLQDRAALQTGYPTTFPGWEQPDRPKVNWDFVGMRVVVSDVTRRYEFEILYGLHENLLTWLKVLIPCKIPVTAFISLRVGGKSGSWCDVHNPKDSFIRTIAAGPSDLQPKFWGADRTELLDIDEGGPWPVLRIENATAWRRTFPGVNDGYGLLQWLLCDWSKIDPQNPNGNGTRDAGRT